MKMKVAQYIAEFFAGKGICDCFMITGGGAMHLNDAFGHNDKINCIFNHHEQSSAICAEGYARVSGKPAAICVTSGPGGTNALTGVMGAWVDSIPMFIVSGQVKRETTVRACPELKLRQLGDQEYDITKAAAHMTKYAVMLNEPLDVAYELEKAYWLATNGRKGPVWIDVPLDVQAAVIDSDELNHFDVSAFKADGDVSEINISDSHGKSHAFNPGGSDILKAELEAAHNVLPVSCDIVKKIAEKIKNAKAPAFLLGTGLHLASLGTDTISSILDKFKIPALVAWNANDLLAYDNPYFAGMPGTVGTRYGNFVLQNCDLLISLGCRMNIRMTGYEHFDFAKNAEIIAIDIDERELKKPTLKIGMPVHADLGDFLPKLFDVFYEPSDEQKAAHEKWLSWCKGLINEFPVVLQEYHCVESAGKSSSKLLSDEDGNSQKKPSGAESVLNPYVFIDILFDNLSASDIIACGNGSACVITFQAAKIKQGQRMFTNSGCASMGYGFPAAIGAAVAAGSGCNKEVPSYKRNARNEALSSENDDTSNGRIICIDGDGSIMMNIQEMATLAHHKFNIKIFLLNNNGYHSIRQTQTNLFDGNFVGIDPESGVSFPDFSKLADSFGINYLRIENEVECSDVINEALNAEGPVLVETMVDPSQNFEPKISSRVNEDGTITSATLDDMAPFLSREEYERIKFR